MSNPLSYSFLSLGMIHSKESFFNEYRAISSHINLTFFPPYLQFDEIPRVFQHTHNTTKTIWLLKVYKQKSQWRATRTTTPDLWLLRNTETDEVDLDGLLQGELYKRDCDHQLISRTDDLTALIWPRAVSLYFTSKPLFVYGCNWTRRSTFWVFVCKICSRWRTVISEHNDIMIWITFTT